jgi:hypothetical protein
MKGGIDLIALLLGQASGSGADLISWRGCDYFMRGGVDGKHANFADSPDAGAGEHDRSDPHVQPVQA